MDVSFGRVRAIDAGVWTGALSQGDAKRLPGAPLKIAGPHVLLLQRPAWDGQVLKAPFDGVSVLALGSAEAAIFLSAADARPAAGDDDATASPEAAAETPAPSPAPRRPGDTGDDAAFVSECAQLGSDMERVAAAPAFARRTPAR